MQATLYRQQPATANTPRRQSKTRSTTAALSIAAAIAAMCVTPGAVAAGAIKAAYVEAVIPSKPFFKTLQYPTGRDYFVVGAETGVLGVTSITITNTGTRQGEVTVYPQAAFASPGCNIFSLTVNIGAAVATFTVPPNSTLHVPYPSPLVVTPNPAAPGLSTCLVVYGSGVLSVTFNGMVN